MNLFMDLKRGFTLKHPVSEGGWWQQGHEAKRLEDNCCHPTHASRMSNVSCLLSDVGVMDSWNDVKNDIIMMMIMLLYLKSLIFIQ